MGLAAGVSWQVYPRSFPRIPVLPAPIQPCRGSFSSASVQGGTLLGRAEGGKSRDARALEGVIPGGDRVHQCPATLGEGEGTIACPRVRPAGWQCPRPSHGAAERCAADPHPPPLLPTAGLGRAGGPGAAEPPPAAVCPWPSGSPGASPAPGGSRTGQHVEERGAAGGAGTRSPDTRPGAEEP